MSTGGRKNKENNIYSIYFSVKFPFAGKKKVFAWPFIFHVNFEPPWIRSISGVISREKDTECFCAPASVLHQRQWSIPGNETAIWLWCAHNSNQFSILERSQKKFPSIGVVGCYLFRWHNILTCYEHKIAKSCLLVFWGYEVFLCVLMDWMVLSFQYANKKPPQGDGPLKGHSLEIYQSTLQKIWFYWRTSQPLVAIWLKVRFCCGKQLPRYA